MHRHDEVQVVTLTVGDHGQCPRRFSEVQREILPIHDLQRSHEVGVVEADPALRSLILAGDDFLRLPALILVAGQKRPRLADVEVEPPRLVLDQQRNPLERIEHVLDAHRGLVALALGNDAAVVWVVSLDEGRVENPVAYDGEEQLVGD